MIARPPAPALVPTRLWPTTWYIWPIWLAQVSDGAIFVALPPLCRRLGIPWSGAVRTLQVDWLAGPQVACLALPGHMVPTLWLDSHYLAGWLLQWEPARFAPRNRAHIEAYQAAAGRVLWERQRGQVAGIESPDPEAYARAVLRALLGA